MAKPDAPPRYDERQASHASRTSEGRSSSTTAAGADAAAQPVPGQRTRTRLQGWPGTRRDRCLIISKSHRPKCLAAFCDNRAASECAIFFEGRVLPSLEVDENFSFFRQAGRAAYGSRYLSWLTFCLSTLWHRAAHTHSLAICSSTGEIMSTKRVQPIGRWWLRLYYRLVTAPNNLLIV